MKSKISFFNKGIFLDDLRRFGWISAVHTFALFFLIPLRIIMMYSREEGKTEAMRSLFYYCRYYYHYASDRFQGFLMLAVPVLLGILLFRYIQVKVESDMLHSLPVKRDVLFRSHVSAGALILFLPILIIAATCLLLNAALGLQAYYGMPDILHWAGVSILMSLVLFMLSIFVGMNVGISTLQGVLTYIMLFLPAGFILLMNYNLKLFLYGYAGNSDRPIEKLSPAVRILEGFIKDADKGNTMGAGEIIAYIAICGALYFLAQFLYGKRKLEAASQPFAFKKLHYIFVYGVTFCTMLLAGAYFDATQESMGWVLFGYAIGSLTGYFAAQMLARKTFWVFRNIKGYAVYVAVIILMLVGIKLDIFGYEKYIPALDQVESIYFGSYFDDDEPDFSNPDNLENIYALHKEILKGKGNNKYNRDSKADGIVFAYQLKNGKRIKRAYDVHMDDYAKYLKPIYEAKEYKEIKKEMLLAAASDIEKITISPNADINKKAIIINPTDIAEALQALKSDVYSETFEQMQDPAASWAYIRILIADDKTSKYPMLDELSEKMFHVPWEKSYKQFEACLSKKGYLENARMLPEDIAYAIVEKVENKQEWEERKAEGRYDPQKGKGNTKRLEIKDKNQIEACIRNYKVRWTEWTESEAQYIIGFYGEGGTDIELGRFDEKSAPDFVKAFFN